MARPFISLSNGLSGYRLALDIPGMSRKYCPPENLYPRINFSVIVLELLSYPENFCLLGQAMSRHGSVFLGVLVLLAACKSVFFLLFYMFYNLFHTF